MDAEGSPSARAELRFAVARRLGLDPRSLLEDAGEPRFLWREEARFKHLTTEDDTERAGIASFGRAVAIAIAAAAPSTAVGLVGHTAHELRETLLAQGRPFVALQDLVALSWSAGIPVVHLRVFPWPQKRMAAMTIRVGHRTCILMAKDALYPAWVAFYLAHELAHVALAHLENDEAVVDLEREHFGSDEPDDEEVRADTWALELLTGRSRPIVDSLDGAKSARELARVARSAGPALGIEPGTLALLFGYTTNEWAIVNAALRRIYSQPAPVWRAINAYAQRELPLDDASPDTAEFIRHVLALNDLG